MATTEAGRLLTVQHRQQQIAVRAATLRTVTQLWGLWDGVTIADFDRFSTPAAAIVQAGYRTSAGVAAGYYQALRVAEGAPGAPTPRVADPPPTSKVVGNLRATGLAGTMRGVRAGLSPQAAARSGLVQALGSAGRMVMRGAGDTLAASAKDDPRSSGWRRVTSADPCEWCAGQTGEPTSEEFQSHDHCSCTAEPVFT